MPKFSFHKFLAVLNAVGPIVLLAVPGGAAVAPIIPVVVHAIGEAEQIKGASGAEKKQHVLNVVADAVTTANATNKVKIDPAEAQTVAAHGIDTVVGTIHVIEGAKVVKAPEGK